MRFGLLANLHRDGARYAVEQVIEWAEHGNYQLVVTEPLARSVGGNLTIVNETEIADHADIIISIGGDGTLLRASRLVGNRGIPLLGINAGSLGFLTQMPPEQLIPALEAVARKEYSLDERMLLQVKIVGKNNLEYPYALNEVVIDNGPVSRLIRIHFKVNNEDIVTYQADGLVIATPTGSTAYSLAVGGPIMNPNLEGIIASPISSFSLTTRPMILAPSDILELRISSEHRVAGLTLDGQIMSPLEDTDTVIISKADFKMKFITFGHQSFYRLVKSKLHWGLSPRGG